MNTKYYNWYEGSANFQTTRFISLKGLSFIWPSVKRNIFERSLSTIKYLNFDKIHKHEVIM